LYNIYYATWQLFFKTMSTGDFYFFAWNTRKTLYIITDLKLWLILLTSIFFSFFIYLKHYQKIDKYKRKYRENISVGKFSRDFTDKNISSVYIEGITMRKKIKTKQKKKDDVSFLPTEFIPSVKSLVNYEHYSSCQL